MRTPLIAGNWKMNKDIHETAALIAELKERLKDFRREVDVVLCPPFPSLVVAGTLLRESPMKLGAQNMSERDEGALTGEVSGRMLKVLGCEYVILGHSERRQFFKESNELVNAKVKKALKSDLRPIICVGETLEEREAGVTEAIIGAQIEGALHELSESEFEKCAVAYEPVWAIGTGRNATPDQANQVHKFIRKVISRLFSWKTAERLVIQYGGSVNEKNSADLLSQSDIDGALVGGASLKSDSFIRIIQAGVETSRKP